MLRRTRGLPPKIPTVVNSFLQRFVTGGVITGTPGPTDDELITYFETIYNYVWDPVAHSFIPGIVDSPGGVPDGHISAPGPPDHQLAIIDLSPKDPSTPGTRYTDTFVAELGGTATPHPSTWSAAYGPFIWGFVVIFGELFTTTDEEKRMIAAVKAFPNSPNRIDFVITKRGV